MLVNAVREGLGYEIESEVIDMELFYFDGINIEDEMMKSGATATTLRRSTIRRKRRLN